MEKDSSPLSLFTAQLQIANAVRHDGQVQQVIRLVLEGNQMGQGGPHEVVSLPVLYLDKSQALEFSKRLQAVAGVMDGETQSSVPDRLQ